MRGLIEAWFNFILNIQEKIFTNKTLVNIAKKQIEIEQKIRDEINKK